MTLKCVDFLGNTHIVDEADVIDRLSVYCVYIVNETVLMMQDSYSHRWELPGGGTEGNETEQEGLIREFLEETGLHMLDVPTLIDEWTEYYFDLPTNQAWHSKRKFYTTTTTDGELLTKGNNDDSMAAQFIALDQIKHRVVAPRIREVIDLAVKLARK